MTADDLMAIAYQKPFRPFRVRLKSGEQFDIRRTLRTAIAPDRVVFGIDEDEASGVARRMRLVALKQITGVEILESVT